MKPKNHVKYKKYYWGNDENINETLQNKLIILNYSNLLKKDKLVFTFLPLHKCSSVQGCTRSWG